MVFKLFIVQNNAADHTLLEMDGCVNVRVYAVWWYRQYMATAALLDY